MGPDQGVDQQKVVVEAVMTKGVEQATPPATEEQKIARHMRTAIDQGNAREALRITTEPKVENKDLAKKIEEIGVTRDDTGKKAKTLEEQQRYDRAKNAFDLVDKFVEKGYGKLSSAEQTNIQTTVIEQIRKNPVLAEKYRTMSRAEQKEYVLSLIQDPKNTEKVRQILSEVASAPELSDLVEVAKDKIDEKIREKKIKEEEVADIQRRSDAVAARLKDFERPAGGATMGKKVQELEDIRTELPTLETEKQTYAHQYQDAEFRFAQLQQERAATLRNPGTTGRRDIAEIDTDITNARSEMQNAQREVGERQAKINKVSQLEEEERTLESDKRNTDIEMRGVKLELGKIDLDLAKIQREYNNALSLRESQEMDIVNGLENVFANAAIDVLNDREDEVYNQYDVSLKELRDKATTDAEKAILNAIEERHKRRVPVRRLRGAEQQRKIDKAKVLSDFNMLMTNGPEEFMKAVLAGAKNPETGNPYTEEEIEKLMKNQDLISKTQPEAVKQLLAKRFMVGKISEGDAYFISTSKWGEELIDKAIATNQDVRDKLVKLYGEGVIDQPGFSKRFAKEVGATGLLSAILAGIIAIPIISAAAAAREGNKIYR